jgi:hypothetical protein
MELRMIIGRQKSGGSWIEARQGKKVTETPSQPLSWAKWHVAVAQLCRRHK